MTKPVPGRSKFDDFVPAPNISGDPEIYELENQAIAADGRLDSALRSVADWSGRRLLDIGCGTGFWLSLYATDASSVVGVEPDPDLVAHAERRVEGLDNVRVVRGSAEHLPLPDASVDVAHARFAYFFGPGAEQGLAEVRRVLAPGGVFVTVDNSWRSGEFAELLVDSSEGNGAIDPTVTDTWWADNDAERVEVDAGWAAGSTDELRRILRIEFPSDTVDRFERRHARADLTYAMALFVINA
ncbi:MAG: class I SAM-dependent methyltransferase [Acidimicrobiia bacterium]